MTDSADCRGCNGTGETLKMTPGMRARFVSNDDLCPSDFSETCGFCLGDGVDRGYEDELQEEL